MEDTLSKLERAVREFDRGVLVQKTVVQTTESFVSLTYLPLLPIELNFDNVVSVCSMVSFILHHPSARNRYLKRNFEEQTSLASAIFCALLYMVDECLARKED